MGAPPAFNPPRQQSSNKVWLWVLVAVVAFCLVCGIGLFFMVRSGISMGMSMIGCTVNADLARDAVVAYAMEHDGQFPNAATWQDDVRPYYERLYQKFVVDSEFKDMPDWFQPKIAAPGTMLTCDIGGSVTGFAFNALLAGKKLDDFPDKASTVVIWETQTPALNANGDPATRVNLQQPKIMGDSRDWIDFFIEGQNEPLQSENEDFDFESTPEDALTPGSTTGTSNPTGA